MMARIGNQQQFWSGLIFAGLGIATLCLLPPEIGTASAMGPGYFPMLLGIGLILLGGASAVFGFRSSAGIKAHPLPARTIFLMLGGMVAFALLIKEVGLAVSLFCLIGLSCAERLRRHALEVLVIYLVLLSLTWFIFIYVVQLPINLGWWG